MAASVERKKREHFPALAAPAGLRRLQKHAKAGRF
jgi:hypothetical protein